MRFFRFAVATLALSACGEEKPLNVLVEDAARHYNSNGEDAFAFLYSGSKTRAFAEGDDTLVVRIDNIPSGKQTVDPIMWGKGVRKGLCADGYVRDMVGKGAKLRVEMRSNMGVDLPTTHLASCVG